MYPTSDVSIKVMHEHIAHTLGQAHIASRRIFDAGALIERVDDA